MMFFILWAASRLRSLGKLAALWFAALTVIAAPLVAAAAPPEQCDSSKPRQTPSGSVTRTLCKAPGGGYVESLLVNGNPILRDERLFDDDRNKAGTIRVYSSGASSPTTGCTARLYVVDFGSSAGAKVLSFGVKNACNEFHWASWGDKRSVIALKHNVRFVYENDNLIPPEKGEKLWKAIEPPRAGNGLALEDAIPFVEEVPQPK